MFQNCSKSSKKRQSTDTGTIYNPLKKIKFEESSIGCNQSKPTDVEGATNKATKLVSLILVGQNRNVQNYPSQLVWCRTDKTPFWPAMVWPCHKSDRVSEDGKCFDITLTVIRLDRFPVRGTSSGEIFRQKQCKHLDEVGKCVPFRWA